MSRFTRAEGHADADFVGALARGVGGDSVNSHRCEDQGEQTEGSDECSGDALGKAGKLLAQFEGGDIEDAQVGVQFVHRFFDCFCRRERIAGDARSDDHSERDTLVQRQIEEREWAFR